MKIMPFYEAAKLAILNESAISRVEWSEALSKDESVFVYYVKANSYPAVSGAAKKYFGENSKVPYRGYFAMKTVSDDVRVWNENGDDSLADDWYVLDL